MTANNGFAVVFPKAPYLLFKVRTCKVRFIIAAIPDTDTPYQAQSTIQMPSKPLVSRANMLCPDNSRQSQQYQRIPMDQLF